MTFTIKVGDIEYYNGPVEKMPFMCLEPRNRDELEELLDISSNWMKLFNASSYLSVNTLRKILWIEMCGRGRPDVVDRTRALIDTRLRTQYKQEVEDTFEEIQRLKE